MVFVALAGPLSNLLLAVLFTAGWKFFLVHGLYHGAARTMAGRSQDLLPSLLGFAAFWNVLLAMFNLIPVPPLDGSRLMERILPEPLRAGYASLGTVGIVLVFLLVNFVPAVNHQLGQAVGLVLECIDRLVPIGPS
jgi:Zn-dependent protease